MLSEIRLWICRRVEAVFIYFVYVYSGSGKNPPKKPEGKLTENENENNDSKKKAITYNVKTGVKSGVSRLKDREHRGLGAS